MMIWFDLIWCDDYTDDGDQEDRLKNKGKGNDDDRKEHQESLISNQSQINCANTFHFNHSSKQAVTFNEKTKRERKRTTRFLKWMKRTCTLYTLHCTAEEDSPLFIVKRR